MHTTQCDGCGAATPSHDITHYGSIETGYKNLCSICFNAQVAERCGLDDFENIRLEPITITDNTGQAHEFHFVTRLLGNILSLEAFELQDSVPAGYQFQIIGDPEDDLFALLGRMVEKIRRALSVKYLTDDPRHGLQITGQSVQGHLESDPSFDERTPLLVIDGREVTWEEFGQILMTFEGSQFKLELIDRSDEP
ncbi:MAG: DUF7686 domain-containing protein [Rhodoferax sp.]